MTILPSNLISKERVGNSFSQCGFGLVTIVPNCLPTNRNNLVPNNWFPQREICNLLAQGMSENRLPLYL